MALIKQYGLSGVHSDLQFGKSNARIKFDASDVAFEARNLADDDYVNFRVAEPLQNRDAATKYYVDSVAQGLKPKAAVRVATNSLTTIDSNVNSGTATDDMTNLSYSSANDEWTLTGGVIDGVTLADGDRVLIKDATGGDAVGNGIWVFDSSAGSLSRATDADNTAPAGEAAANASGDIIVKGQKSDPSFAINMTYTLTANGVEYTYGPTTTNDRNYFAGINGLNIPGLTIGWHNDDGFINAIQLTYEPQTTGDELVIADTTGWSHLAITHGTYTSSGGANAAGTELGGGVFVFVLEGTVWQDSGWVVSSPTGTATIGTDPISWVQFSRVTGIYADDGLAQDGNKIYVRTDGTTIYIDDDDLAVKSSSTQYQTLISDGAGGTATWGAIQLGVGSAVTGVLPEYNGGTGESTYGHHDLLMGDATNGLTRLVVGNTFTVLSVNSQGALTYGAVQLDQANAVDGTLPESHGGTGQSSYTEGDLLYASSTGNDGTLDKLAIGNSGEILIVQGGVPVWGGTGNVVGVTNTRRVAISTSDVNIGSALPANVRVVQAKVNITNAYTAGTTISIGQTSDVDEIASADEIDPETVGVYQIDLMHLYTSSTQLLATITGASTGAGYIIVDYVAE